MEGKSDLLHFIASAICIHDSLFLSLSISDPGCTTFTFISLPSLTGCFTWTHKYQFHSHFCFFLSLSVSLYAIPFSCCVNNIARTAWKILTRVYAFPFLNNSFVFLHQTAKIACRSSYIASQAAICFFGNTGHYFNNGETQGGDNDGGIVKTGGRRSRRNVP